MIYVINLSFKVDKEVSEFVALFYNGNRYVYFYEFIIKIYADLMFLVFYSTLLSTIDLDFSRIF